MKKPNEKVGITDKASVVLKNKKGEVVKKIGSKNDRNGGKTHSQAV